MVSAVSCGLVNRLRITLGDLFIILIAQKPFFQEWGGWLAAMNKYTLKLDYNPPIIVLSDYQVLDYSFIVLSCFSCHGGLELLELFSARSLFEFSAFSTISYCEVLL